MFCLLPAVFAQSQFQLESGGGEIDVSIETGRLSLPVPEVTAWVKNAADAVTTYYGRFPVSHLTLRIETVDGHGVRNGRTIARHGGLILIRLGRDTSKEELESDWMMTHEMVHLAFPSLPDKNHWMEEGLSTYVEPIARIQAGQMNAASMWSDLVRDMPKGLPEPGDQGLDNTHTWANTYWGGALFCFLADVQIRDATHNQKGLQDALRGILDAGGSINQDWELSATLKIGDRATGTQVLTTMYEKMGPQPMSPNLGDWWAKLGIQTRNGTLQFQDDAELAAIRKAITAPAPNK